METNNDNKNKTNSIIIKLKTEEEEEEELACAVSYSVSGMEMIHLQPAMSTSLKHILPASPTYQNSSWNEIPIKNPLVKQAALAYLPPMATPPEVGDKGLLGRLKLGKCCKECQCGCLQWINDVVFIPFREFFWRSREEVDDNDDDNDNDHDNID